MTDIRGFKRICGSCATRFYDFNKSPIICPKCKAEFTGVVKIRTRRGKAVVDDVKTKPEEEEIEKVDGDDTTVSLTDLEDEEKGDDEDEDEVAGDLDLDDLDDDAEDDEDLEDLDEDIEIEEKE